MIPLSPKDQASSLLECIFIPIKRRKVYEHIVEHIEQCIVTGGLRLGDRLPTERQLCEHFHASRTAVREAMKILAQKGLIDICPGRGTIVTDATVQAMQHSLELMMSIGQSRRSEDLIEVYEILAPEIVVLAARRATDKDIAALREPVRIMENSVHTSDIFLDANSDFHLAVAQATQNMLILVLVEVIAHVLNEQRQPIFSLFASTENVHMYYKQILDAITHHDAIAAQTAMRASLRQAREDAKSATT